jgi:hypothetical protein
MTPTDRKRARGKRIRCEFESSISSDDNYHFLYPPYEGKFIVPHEQFKPGDRVRVTVELLRRTKEGEKLSEHGGKRRGAGRKRILSEQQIICAKRAHTELSLPWRIVAERMGISVWTLYDALRRKQAKP